MQDLSEKGLLAQIEELKTELSEARQLIQAIKDGEVDAFAVGGEVPEVYTLQSGDYAYRVLIEEFGEGAINVTEDGLIVYTNRYFFEFTGLSYEQVIGSNIFSYIEPASANAFSTLFTRALTGRSKGEITLAINGAILPVYISMTSLQPNLPTVGIIISDMSQQKKSEAVILQYQKDLQDQNLALTRSNEELKSFAYMASHDLQEPLRKINMYTAQILDMAKEDFSPDTAEYFQRITASTKRMQNLILALLEYSRLNTSGTGLVSTDLNILLQEVKNSFAEVLEQTKATLTISTLPVTQVIPYQITQLFANLIQNALKYKKPGVAPTISISSQMVTSRDILWYPHPKFERFYRLQVVDNGIGFDPAHNERIFELFQRLHGKDEYEGTGIGLAICRKIVQTHKGYITAEGRPGIGAIFNVYLPFIRGQISER